MIIPEELKKLPKDILDEWLEEIKRQGFEHNIHIYRNEALGYMLGGISFEAAKKGREYWLDIRNRAYAGEFDVPFHTKYLKVGAEVKNMK